MTADFGSFSSGGFVKNDLDAFHQLVSNLNTTLGPTGGIAKENIDTETLMSLMRNYKSEEKQWTRYAFADSSRAYTRNLVDKGNVNSNLLLLVWSPGRESPVHDHADAHCIMKILKGSLKETRFEWPNNSAGPTPLKVIRESIYKTNEVAYMSDDLGLHCIANMSQTEFAYSLHLYTPPNASKEGCSIFERATSIPHHITMCSWYSELGKKCQGPNHNSTSGSISASVKPQIAATLATAQL